MDQALMSSLATVNLPLRRAAKMTDLVMCDSIYVYM